MRALLKIISLITLLAVTVFATIRNPGIGVPTSQVFMANDNDHYQAPLENSNSPAAVKDSYEVYLKPGYTLEQHKQTVGNSLSKDDIKHVRASPRRDYVLYTAILRPDTLAAVRADTGVELVECTLAFGVGWA